MDLPAEIITFYSYKGGTGRSMALANIATLLVRQKSAKRGVLMIDWDLEAPGLHRYFADRVTRRFGPDSNDAYLKHPGLIELFQGLREHVESMPHSLEDPPAESIRQLEKKLRFDDFVVETDIPRLHLLKAGAFTEQYARLVNTFPWENLYHKAPWLIPLFIDWVSSRFSYVLVDSRTGITDTSGICTMLLPDKLVVVFTPNTQSLDGVAEMTERATNYRRKSTVRPLSVYPLPSRIEGSEPQQLQEWRNGEEGYQHRFESLFRRVFSLPVCKLQKYFDEVQIQQVATYAYGEKVAALIELDDNRIGLKRSFIAFMEKLIAENDIWEEPSNEASATAGERIADQATAIYSSLSAPQQEAVRSLFLSLVRIVNGEPRLSGERTVSALAPIQSEIAALYVSKGILDRTGDSLRAVSEFLAATWDQLSDWVKADKEFMEWHTLLGSFLIDWEKSGHMETELLEGSKLHRAGKYLQSHGALLEARERQYIELSLAISRRRTNRRMSVAAAVLLILLGVLIWNSAFVRSLSGTSFGKVRDEASVAGRLASSFPGAEEDYFQAMDSGVALSRDEISGRNAWLVWTGGNDRFWDRMAMTSGGSFDLLKTISSYSGLKFNRDNRWTYLGLVNEPCFKKVTEPNPNRYGLWLDVRDPSCPPDPFENDTKYPGVKLGARGKNIPVGSYYGYATGIVGLRLFPNPEFDEAAAKKWNSVRFYADPSYYNDRNLIRPYRVGVTCAFCHVGPNPVNAPADPENPKWENLSSNAGSQYLWSDRITAWDGDPSSFPFQLFHTSRPGTLDMSLVPSDNINNPRTMAAIYEFASLLELARRWGKETLVGPQLNNDQLQQGKLRDFFQPPNTVFAPKLLKDGSDSVGVLGALNRAYLNIGLFSEESLLHFRPLIGGTPMTPMEISVANKNSIYWRATETQTRDMALFLIKDMAKHLLKDAPGGDAYLPKDNAKLERGKIVFAERCARCHSSKIPEGAPGLDAGAGCSGKDYLHCWNQYWTWTKTEDFKAKMRAMVQKPDFLDNNYLSTDLLVPLTLMQTNACGALASNAVAGGVWDNFSSQTYKYLPAIGKITWYHPVTGQPRTYQMPGGGRGYSRPASLISVWSTAPFLSNNSLGKFNQNPSAAARMESFEDSIEKMLWPEKREQDSVLGNKVPGVIDRTTQVSYIQVPGDYLPSYLRPLLSTGERYLPGIFGEGSVTIGPIPRGTPVNLLANLDLTGESLNPQDRELHQQKVIDLLLKMQNNLSTLGSYASDDDARNAFANLVDPLLELSKCPDFVVNRGHYFGTSYFAEEPGLSDDDKRALIDYIKTF
jgi:cellulose biosynthesis protein BcsQ